MSCNPPSCESKKGGEPFNNVLTRTEGIVLKTQQYGDADSIITHLTLCKGIIKTFARSPRKTKSRFGSSLEPLTHAKISLWGKEQSMPKITQSDILNSFHDIRENLQDFANTSKLIEILIHLMPEGVPNKKIFLFFLNMMDILKSSEQKQKRALYLVFQVRLLEVLGYAPRLTGCGRCDAKSLDFYADSGTTLCKKCAAAHVGERKLPIKVADRAVCFYSHCIGWPVHASTRLRPSGETISELSALLDEHLNHLLNKRLLTSEFLAKVQHT